MTNKKNYRLTIVLIFLSTIGLNSCSNKSADESSSDSDDSTNSAVVQSATVIVGNALQGAAQSFIEPFAQCSTEAFSSCNSAVRTRTLSGCERSNSANSVVLFYGTVNLTFNSDATCTTAFSSTSGSVTRTVENYYAVNEATDYKIIEYTNVGTVAGKTISSNDLKDYTGDVRSGGTTVTFLDASSRQITINGVHRRGVRPSGLYGFWHTTYTTNPLSVTNTGTEYTIASGTVIVAHNRLAATVTNTFSNVEYPLDGSCCYPTSGSVSSVTGAETTTTVFSSTCGNVTINGESATLSPCGGGN